jgi:hypothetical protein
MKKEAFQWIGMGSGFIASVLAGFYYLETQKAHFLKMEEDYENLHRQLKELEKDLAFVNRHQKDLALLVEKGWFVPKSRLIAAETIEQLSSMLPHVRYTFEPEKITKREGNQTYKVTLLTFVIEALLDTDIYAFLQVLLEKFPGVLCPRELMLMRKDMTQEEAPTFVEGTLVLEWVSSGEAHEK